MPHYGGLREEGHLVGKNRVARLMKVAGIEGVSRRRKTARS